VTGGPSSTDGPSANGAGGLVCLDERRREDVRAAPANGIDYLEVSGDQRTLTVYFLGKAPLHVRRGNVRIDGGPRARPVEVDGDPTVYRDDAPDVDDHMTIRVGAPGDFSTYTLRLVKADGRGQPTERPLAGFDPRYARLRFSFKVDCTTGLDCAAPPDCPPPHLDEPAIDYLAKDYASFRQLVLDRLTLVMPDWRERHVPDLGIALVEILAYVGDHLSYYQDAVATEAYLATARRRVSVRRHARLVDYAVHEGCNARALVVLRADADRPALDLTTVRLFAGEEAFEPLVVDGRQTLSLRSAHNAISFYTWGNRECRLPAGATRATLRDAWRADGKGRALDLKVGDILVFEEVLGPATGQPADADPSRRHAVRLTRVDAGEAAVDRLYQRPAGIPVVEIAWAEQDALPFAFCLSALGPAPGCAPVTDVSVARGNVVLADHGRSESAELGTVASAETPGCCEGEGRPADVTPLPRPFTPPPPSRSPLTHAEPLAPGLPAARLLAQDPRRAEPAIWLHQTGGDLPAGGRRWLPRPDLLGSGPRDPHFVVEVDDDGRARLRFGDGRLGQRPEAGTGFAAHYRAGNGPVGNVAAETINRITIVGEPGTPGIHPRNPLPAAGGTAAEPVADVKALAPIAFRSRLQRAVTPADYAVLAAEADPSGTRSRVQRAATTPRWTGGWYEMLTTVDPFGAAEADDELIEAVARKLSRFRRIGHDLVVAPASYVPLDVALSVCVRPGFVRGHVKAALLDALSNRERPGGRRGLFHPDNLTFGDPVAASRIVAAAQAVTGVESVTVTKLERLFEGPNGELGAGVLRVGPTEVARLDNDPNAPDHGVLTLTLRGGR
jgi:hypothetical protein